MIKQIIVNVPSGIEVNFKQEDGKIICDIINTREKVICGLFRFRPIPEDYFISEIGLPDFTVNFFEANGIYKLDKLLKAVDCGHFEYKGIKTKIPLETRENIIEELKAFDVNFIDEEKLSTRIITALKYRRIYTNEQLAGLTELDLYRIRNLGDNSVKEVKQYLADLGMQLRE